LCALKFPSEYGFDLVRGHVKKTSDTEIAGYSRQIERYYTGPWQDYTLYFVIRFSRAFSSVGFWNGGNVITNASETASLLDAPIGVFANFAVGTGELEHSGRSCRTGGNRVTVRTCWPLNQQVGLREMLGKYARGNSPSS
jgi:hypothetical protein